MPTSTRVIKNTGFLYFRLGMSLLISLWTTRILLEALGFDNFGIYNVVGGVIALLGFLNGTLSTATQRFINFAEGEGNLKKQLQIFNNSFILHTILGIILTFCFFIIGIICFNGLLEIPINQLHSAKIVYVFMCFTALLTVMNVPYEASIVAHEDMIFYAYIGILEVIAKLAIAFIIKYSTCNRLILYGLLMMIVPIVTFILMRVYCIKKYSECNISLKKNIDYTILRDMSKFAGWNFVNSASGVVTQYGLNIVINHFYGVLLNAAQGIANQVSGVLVSISSNALKSLNPIIVKSESTHQRNRVLYVSLLGCRVSFFLFATFSIPLVFLMDNILKIWLKDVPPFAVIFCQLQLIRITLEMLTYSLSTPILAQGDIRDYNISRSIINLLPIIIISIMFANGFQPYWMYVVWTICWSIFGGIINLYFCHKNVDLSYHQYLKDVLIPSLSCILPALILLSSSLIVNLEIYRYIILLVSEIVFLVFSWKLICRAEERKEISRIVSHIFTFKIISKE